MHRLLLSEEHTSCRNK